MHFFNLDEVTRISIYGKSGGQIFFSGGDAQTISLTLQVVKELENEIYLRLGGESLSRKRRDMLLEEELRQSAGKKKPASKFLNQQ